MTPLSDNVTSCLNRCLLGHNLSLQVPAARVNHSPAPPCCFCIIMKNSLSIFNGTDHKTTSVRSVRRSAVRHPFGHCRYYPTVTWTYDNGKTILKPITALRKSSRTDKFRTPEDLSFIVRLPPSAALLPPFGFGIVAPKIHNAAKRYLIPLPALLSPAALVCCLCCLCFS